MIYLLVALFLMRLWLLKRVYDCEYFFVISLFANVLCYELCTRALF